MMARIYLGKGKWFDEQAAVAYPEATRWDGPQQVSCATGTPWDHEILYQTKSGVWVLNRWSQWQDTRPTYEEMTADEARRWLVAQGHPEVLS